MESSFVNNFENSPLSTEEISLIGSTNLSASEKHHLRMLAHCLECFKSMSKKDSTGLIPSKDVWLEWCLTSPKMVQDDEYVQVLFEHFSGAAIQLERLSRLFKVSPLNLTLRDLIAAYEQKCH